MIFWNAYGLGNEGTLNHLKFLVKHHQIKMLDLVEPQISGYNAVRACRRLGFDGCHRVEANDVSGGIWLLWQTQAFTVSLLHEHT